MMTFSGSRTMRVSAIGTYTRIFDIYVCIFICIKQRTTSSFLFVNKQLCYFKSFYFAESSRVVYSQRETKRLSSAWCKQIYTHIYQIYVYIYYLLFLLIIFGLRAFELVQHKANNEVYHLLFLISHCFLYIHSEMSRLLKLN